MQGVTCFDRLKLVFVLVQLLSGYVGFTESLASGLECRRDQILRPGSHSWAETSQGCINKFEGVYGFAQDGSSMLARMFSGALPSRRDEKVRSPKLHPSSLILRESVS